MKDRFKEDLGIVFVIFALLGTGTILYGLTPQLPLLLVLMGLMAWLRYYRKEDWDDIQDGIIQGVSSAIAPLLLFLFIGSLIAVWLKSGVIPSLMVLGFDLIHENIFLPSVFVVCSLVGTSIGSGFTTISTLGLAFMGMGATIGVRPEMVAGAVISGAMLGDKMSPLSDTTNLAPAIAGTDLFRHIQNMLWTTIPSFIICLILYFVIEPSVSSTSFSMIQETRQVLVENFSVSIWSFIPILLMFVCSWKRLPAIPTLGLNILVSSLFIFIQDKKFNVVSWSELIQNGLVSKTGNQTVDVLLSRGGIANMMGTVAFILLGLSLAGLLVKFKIIETIMQPFIRKLKRPGDLIAATVLSAVGTNFLIGEQYLSLLLPGNAYRPAFKQMKLKPEMLSRALEDGGSVVNYIVPWGVSGLFSAGALGVPVVQYLPFAFFGILCPFLSIVSGYTGIGLKKEKEEV